AVGDAGAAHDAVHDFGQVRHRLSGGEVLTFGRRAGGLEPGVYSADLRPEGRHIDDEVLDHRHVAGGLDDNRLARVRDGRHLRLAGEAGATVDVHRTGAADRAAAGAAEGEGAVVELAHLNEGVEDGRG